MPTDHRHVYFNFRATQDMLLPLSEPIRMCDGSVISSLPVPKGTRLITNLEACNVDPALWGPDASQWKPDRWLKPLPKAVEEARVPGIYSHMYALSPGATRETRELTVVLTPHRMTFLSGNKACM